MCTSSIPVRFDARSRRLSVLMLLALGATVTACDAEEPTDQGGSSGSTSASSGGGSGNGGGGSDPGVLPPLLEDCRGPEVEAPAPDPRDDAIELRYVDQFELLWNDGGSGGWHDGAFYRPVVPAGFHALGHYGQQDHGVTRGYTFVARELSPGALAPPQGYTRVYSDGGSGADMDGSFWRPEPPAGYVCLGDLAQSGYDAPSVDAVRCVREDLVAPGKIGNGVWNDRGTGADETYGSWQVVPADDHGLFLGTFVGSNSNSTPPAGPVKSLDLRWVKRSPRVDPAKIDELIGRFGPVLRLHPDDKYLPDDAEHTLNHDASIAWGLVTNESDYDAFTVQQLGQRKTSAGTLMDDIAKYATPNDPGSPDFKIWLHLDLGQAGSSLPPVNGLVSRSKALVRVRPWNTLFTDIQFWIFYPFNGAGKFRLSCGAIEDHVVMDGPGRHYGDWEHVTLRVVEGTWELAGVHLSRHSGFEWISGAALRSAIQFQDEHPIVYSARDSHAMYPAPGTHYYLRGFSEDLGICTAALDLEDWTADGGHELPLYEAAHHEVVCSNVPGHAPEIPVWLPYPHRWGQYEKLSYTYEIPVVGAGVYDYEEVGAGPSGPPEKGQWQQGDTPSNWWWLPNLESTELCVDGEDNDGNGQIDCADAGCAADPTCNI
jgi:hypothetical protein